MSNNYIYDDVVVDSMQTQTTEMRIIVTQNIDGVYVEDAFSVVGNQSEVIQAENDETKIIEHTYI